MTDAGAPDAATDGGTDAGAASIEAMTGTWTGAYEAKKTQIEMPRGVQDPARAADDGKIASGPGTVELEIKANGDVIGKSAGALGAATIRGRYDGGYVRASFFADDPMAPHAMTGVLIGKPNGSAIDVELKVAGPDAVQVRKATFSLKKK